METQMAKALAAKGMTARNVQLQLAIAKYQNNGGEFGVAYAMLCAAYGRGSEGHGVISGNGQLDDADASPATGRTSIADKAKPVVPVAHSHAKRGAAAIASVQPTIAKSLFDSTVLPDGRPLRDVRWSECPVLAARYRRLSHILIAVHNHAIPTDPATTLDAIVTERELKRIVSNAEKIND